MTDYIPREAVLEFAEPDARPFLAERIKSIPAADVVSGKDFRDCRNELCLKCGNYRQAHHGACDGCRWRADMRPLKEEKIS